MDCGVVVKLTPNCLLALSPQANTFPELFKNNECVPPAAIIVIPDTLLVPPVSFTVIKVACDVDVPLMPN